MRFRSRLDEILALEPVRDHQRIVHLITCYEFPWDMTRSLELALFRTFCVPRISRLLDQTGEFSARPQKRYDDTDIIVSELLEWGYDSDRGQQAMRVMNRQHGRFRIDNSDFLYVLSSFIYEPIRWFNRFGWRPTTEHERLALFHFWREVARRMGIREIPEDYDAFERFNRDYEATQFRSDPANHRIAVSVLTMFARWFPRPAWPLVDASIRSLMDDAMLRGFGLRRPPPLLRPAVVSALRVRALAIRWSPKRSRPRLRTLGRHRTYPDGYTYAALGPPASAAPDGPAARGGSS